MPTSIRPTWRVSSTARSATRRHGSSAVHALHGICHVWHVGRVLTTFEVLAQPIRRSILDRLRDGEQLVGELAAALDLTQPLTSKHLRVLRDAGLVTVRVDGPRRWYGLRVEPLDRARRLAGAVPLDVGSTASTDWAPTSTRCPIDEGDTDVR